MTDIALSDDERGEIARAVDAGTILSDESLATWVHDTSIDEIVTTIGDDVVFAKRVLEVETARDDDARKGLVTALTKLATPAPTAPEQMAGANLSRWLKLNDDIGVTADGNLEPLVEIGAAVTVPTMVEVDGKQEIAEIPQTITISHADALGARAARIIAGGRIVETTDAKVFSALVDTGNFEEIDRPSKDAIAAHIKALSDAAEEAGTHAQDPDNPQEG